MEEGDLAAGKSIAVERGAWVVFEGEAGQPMTPRHARTWDPSAATGKSATAWWSATLRSPSAGSAARAGAVVDARAVCAD